MNPRNRHLLVGCSFVLVVAVALYAYVNYDLEDLNRSSRGNRHLYHPAGVSFEEIDNIFSLESSLTNLQKEEAWKNYEGKCIAWKGELRHVESGFLGGIRIGMRHKPSTPTYDVQISVPASEKERLGSWRKGRTYPYKGRLRRYVYLMETVYVDWGCEDYR